MLQITIINSGQNIKYNFEETEEGIKGVINWRVFKPWKKWTDHLGEIHFYRVFPPARAPSAHCEEQLNLKQKYSLDLLWISENGICAAKVSEHWYRKRAWKKGNTVEVSPKSNFNLPSNSWLTHELFTCGRHSKMLNGKQLMEDNIQNRDFSCYQPLWKKSIEFESYQTISF